MNNEITSKEYWQQTGVLNSEHREIPAPFKKVFKKYLKKNEQEGKVALEIGCCPGTFLTYLSKEFNYRPEGVDYAEGASDITQKTLREAGLTNGTIHQADFFTWEPGTQYDLVSSFGFIEHFHDVSIGLDKHMSLLKPGGTLVLEVPSFTYGQYYLHKWLDTDNLNRCNIEAMRIDVFKKMVKDYNLDVTFLGHIGGIFDFWWETENPTLLQNIARYILKPMAYIGRRIPIGNRWFSPFIVLIAQKPAQ